MKSQTLIFLILVALLMLGLFSYTMFGSFFKNGEDSELAGRDTVEPVSLTQESPITTFINPMRGEKTAPVTIVEFGDYLCSFCRTIGPTLERVLEEYKGRVKLVWKDFPLSNLHPFAGKLALAGRCAHESGKFWEFHDAAFAAQDVLVNEIEVLRLATELNLGSEFNTCYQARKMEARVQADFDEGTRLGIDGVPYFFIGTKRLSGAVSYERFREAIEEALQK